MHKTISVIHPLTKQYDPIPRIGQGTGLTNKSLLIEEGIHHGMTLIDTAENYKIEDEYVESIVGNIVNEKYYKTKTSIYLASKVSPEHLSYHDVIKSCDKTLTRLKQSYVDIYFIHWSNPEIPLEETLRAMNTLQQQGKIHYIGLCNFTLSQLRQAQLYANISVLQYEYSPLERTIETNGILGTGIPLIAYSPLVHVHHYSLKQKMVLQQLATKYHKSLSQIILNWILRFPHLLTIPKTNNKDHLLENSTAMDFCLENEDLATLSTVFHPQIQYIHPEQIAVIKNESGQKIYTSMEQAMANHWGYSPSPVSLAHEISSSGEFLKPIRVIRQDDPENIRAVKPYHLIGGSLFYWAWRIAFGNKPIPSYVRPSS